MADVSGNYIETGAKLDGSIRSLFIRQVFADERKKGEEGAKDVGSFLAI